MVTFGERLKSERLLKEITLDKLAEELNTTKATLSRYENNIREPKLDLLNTIADYFNCSVDYLLGRTDNREGIIVKEVIHGHTVEVEVDKNIYPNGVSKEEIMKALELVKFAQSKNLSDNSTEK